MTIQSKNTDFWSSLVAKQVELANELLEINVNDGDLSRIQSLSYQTEIIPSSGCNLLRFRGVYNGSNFWIERPFEVSATTLRRSFDDQGDSIEYDTEVTNEDCDSDSDTPIVLKRRRLDGHDLFEKSENRDDTDVDSGDSDSDTSVVLKRRRLDDDAITEDSDNKDDDEVVIEDSDSDTSVVLKRGWLNSHVLFEESEDEDHEIEVNEDFGNETEDIVEDEVNNEGR